MSAAADAAPLLIVGPSWVGDMVMAQSLCQLLHADNPHRPLDIIAPPWSLPIVARMPHVRQGIGLDVKHGEAGLRVRRNLGHALRKQGYARAIVLPRSAKAALVPWHANIPQRSGFRGEFRFGLINDMRVFDKTLLDQTVKRFAALAPATQQPLPAQLPHPVLHIDSAAREQLLVDFALSATTPIVGLLPGAEYGPAKCWPLPHFAAVARSLIAAGVQVCVFGGPKDRNAGAAIVAAAPGAHNLVGETTLADVVDLLSACTAVVSNDSGLMHVAAAVGTHVVAVYGSSSPAFTPPLTDTADIHTLNLSCSPCFERNCPLGHLDCLNNIAPQAVLASVNAALSG
ncbi:MAG: lipopolysaccharide heptosyltransferase II [Pseudomonadota bacterium]